jgi:hypothetical protein
MASGTILLLQTNNHLEAIIYRQALSAAPVAPISLLICRLYVATKIAAIDFHSLALTADAHSFQLGSHSLPQFVRQEEGRFVQVVRITGKWGSRFSLYFFHKDCDCGKE